MKEIRFIGRATCIFHLPASIPLAPKSCQSALPNMMIPCLNEELPEAMTMILTFDSRLCECQPKDPTRRPIGCCFQFKINSSFFNRLFPSALLPLCCCCCCCCCCWLLTHSLLCCARPPLLSQQQLLK